MRSCKRSYLNTACNTALVLSPMITINYFFTNVHYMWLVLLAAALFLHIKASPYIVERKGVLLFIFFPTLKEIPIGLLEVDESNLTFREKGSSNNLIFLEKDEIKKSLLLAIIKSKQK